MNYDQAMALLARHEPFGMRMRLDVMEALLARFGNFHHAMKVVHVGGTNGKGSVTAMVAEALRRAGHRTGRYISPHLAVFEERIVVEGRMIARDDVARGVAEIEPALEAVAREVAPPTYFEAVTLLALRHFARKRVDVAVIEVGLGGRLDATNVFPKPLATIVTNVDLEHTKVLGKDVASIAREKVAIARKGVPFATASKGEALDAILAGASERGAAPITVVGRDVVVEPVNEDAAGQTFRLRGTRRDHGILRTSLAGAHQIENAALAVVALDAVDAVGIAVPLRAVAEGLATTRWPGRLERIEGPPALLLDGAHNPAGMEALARHLETRGIAPVLLFGCLDDKDWMAMILEIAPRVKAAVITRPPTPRALAPNDAARAFSQAGVVATIVEDPRHALVTAIGQAGDDGVVLVAGSLYLVGDVLRILGRDTV
ncbi:MAG TPA: folylpolyglutamate synthase/dihydrofolate synthase family protein [Candidatus Thermoplasmatota archaeon]|nr:folylpolyglutamate synthase/dihydrofolate synthase family protein [Candidatus Thermoplasmatota archaeon]